MQGWIKLHRKLLDWEWYSKPVVKSVFIHSLLRANHKDGKWRGKDVNRGSYISSVDKLTDELGHTRQEIRTALKHLKSTNELTTLSGSQHTVFTVINYDSYQGLTNDLTNEQPAANQPTTTNKNVKNEKNAKNKDTSDSRFDEFYNLYDKKVGGKKAKVKFDSLSKKDIDKIFEVLPDYVASTPEKKYRKAPLVWLNGECWNDEIQKTMMIEACGIDYDLLVNDFNEAMADHEKVPEAIKITESQKQKLSPIANEYKMTNERFKGYFNHCANSDKFSFMINGVAMPAQGISYFLKEETLLKGME